MNDMEKWKDELKEIQSYVDKGVISQKEFDEVKDDPDAITNIMIWIGAAKFMRDISK